MAEITVEKQSEEVYRVTVQSGQTTTHRVTCTPRMIDAYAPGANPEALIRASFEFLLERESNTSILSSFDLPVIERYFPEYRNLIGSRLQG